MNIVTCAEEGCRRQALDPTGCPGYYVPQQYGWDREGSDWWCPEHKANSKRVQPTLALEGLER